MRSEDPSHRSLGLPRLKSTKKVKLEDIFALLKMEGGAFNVFSVDSGRNRRVRVGKGPRKTIKAFLILMTN